MELTLIMESYIVLAYYVALALITASTPVRFGRIWRHWLWHVFMVIQCYGYIYSFLLLNRSSLNNSSEGCLLQPLLGTFFFCCCYCDSFMRFYEVWWVISFWHECLLKTFPLLLIVPPFCGYFYVVQSISLFCFPISISCAESYPFADPLWFVWFSQADGVY